MTTPKSASASVPELREKITLRIVAAQKQADAAKKTVKLAKLTYRQAKLKLKEAKRAAKKLRKAVKTLKKELASVAVKNTRTQAAKKKAPRRRPIAIAAPVAPAVSAPVESTPAPSQ